jgi:hypothetical protein
MSVDPCIKVQFIKKKFNKMQQCIKIYYSIFIWSSTCFGRHTAHHQETKTALTASGFSYVEGCWTLSGAYCVWQRPTTTRLTTFYVWKTRGCQCSFSLLMMGGVSPETCWASYKYEIIKFYALLHLVGFFLYEYFTASFVLSRFPKFTGCSRFTDRRMR